ncbi:MAG TPA: lysylphosphatidylglycerol synthase transmembrane domain-containing protein [Acidimicrobiia bacterium]
MREPEPHLPTDAIVGARSRRWSAGRLTFLAVSALCLYVFAPSIAEAFAAWHGLGRVNPVALVAVLACEVGSFACVWVLQRLALRTNDWFTVINTQLAGNAFNRITPGGGVSGTALQARMLADAGFGFTAAVSALTLQSLLVSAAVVALPVLSLPVILFTGTSVPGDLAEGAWIGAGVFVVMVAIGSVLLGSRRAARRLGSAIEWVFNIMFRRRRAPLAGTGERFLHERDAMRDTLGAAWLPAVGTAVGRWGFEYFALLITLYAIGADPNPALVLIAFAAGSALTMLPFTPGGLGFVEAGLAGALALAGISTVDAVLATLVFRLVSFWLPLPIGAGAAVVFRRRYPRR